MRVLRNASLLLSFLLAACESVPAPASTAPAASPPRSVPQPVATAAPKACLMTHICGCNLGCTGVALDPKTLTEGTKTVAETGSYAGQELFVSKETDTSGAQVFALADRNHTHACERPTPESKTLLGFACAAKDSGPVPANACANGCE